MPDILDGYMYHMSHIENLREILNARALLSQKELESRKINPRSIANQEVQDLRKRIYVQDPSTGQCRPLHSYVPFYFTTHTPMFRNQRERGIQNDIVIFEISRGYIGTIDQSVLFTDGNASNQQLSRNYGETVYITPATVSKGPCIRKYLPDGRPYGTNPRRSDFYADGAFLDRINWDVIEGNVFVEDREEYKRLKHAEALSLDRFPLDEMLSICVSTNEVGNVVRAIFADLELTEADFDLPIVCRPALFY